MSIPFYLNSSNSKRIFQASTYTNSHSKSFIYCHTRALHYFKLSATRTSRIELYFCTVLVSPSFLRPKSGFLCTAVAHIQMCIPTCTEIQEPNSRPSCAPPQPAKRTVHFCKLQCYFQYCCSFSCLCVCMCDVQQLASQLVVVTSGRSVGARMQFPLTAGRACY